VPVLPATLFGGAITFLFAAVTETVPVPWHLVQVLKPVAFVHVGDDEPWHEAVEQVPVYVPAACFAVAGYPFVTSMVPVAWLMVGAVVLFVALA
jgi:hypothetical protein